MARPSRIQQLPADILEQLNGLLRDPRVSQLAVVAQINALLEARGEAALSKSGLNRYKLRMDEVGASLRESREMAEIWVAKLGAAPQGQVGNLTNEIIRTLAFDVSLALQKLTRGELDEEMMGNTVRMIKDLAFAQEKLEKASSENLKRDTQMREAARAEAADAAATEAKRAGLSDDAVLRMRAAIMQELSV